MKHFDIKINEKKTFDELVKSVKFTTTKLYSKIYVGSTINDIKGYLSTKSITNWKVMDKKVVVGDYVVATKGKLLLSKYETILLKIVKKSWNGNERSNFNA